MHCCHLNQVLMLGSKHYKLHRRAKQVAAIPRQCDQYAQRQAHLSCSTVMLYRWALSTASIRLQKKRIGRNEQKAAAAAEEKQTKLFCRTTAFRIHFLHYTDDISIIVSDALIYGGCCDYSKRLHAQKQHANFYTKNTTRKSSTKVRWWRKQIYAWTAIANLE